MPFAVPTLPARATEVKSLSSEDKDAAASATTEQLKENDNNHGSIPQDSIEPNPFAVPSAPVKKGAMLPPSLPTRDSKDSTSSTTTTTTTTLQGEPPQKPRSGEPMLNAPPLKYQKPSWSGYPNQQFSFEVIKNGVVVDRIEAPEKEFMVIGRLPMCDLEMEHPSLSRYHAVVQFKSNGECFIYDLNSSHGTKLNKTKIPPGVHVPLMPGDQLRFGESTRIYLFQTDQTVDQEEEERKMVEAMIEKQNRARSQSRQDDEEEEDIRFGWDQEDAVDEDDDDDDMQDNGVRRAVDPDAYYHKDPKKALRNYLESKGYAYEFEVEEEGPGHAREYTARIRLPIETAMGPVYGEATTGKKRDAEREAALDACIQLDKRGMLGQKAAASEAQKKKSVKVPPKAETHKSLVEKHKNLVRDMSALEQQIQDYDAAASARRALEDANDLDAYMASLAKQGGDSKAKMQQTLAAMKKEDKRLQQLIEYTKPVDFLAKIGAPSSKAESVGSKNAEVETKRPAPEVEEEEAVVKKPRVLGPMRPPTTE
ncbi:Kanadaptin [Podila minutissima]|uniref:Kanadaptin n=1 Tax=Podila minutissima TaxID=64525 RepID=A0A9P5SG05_9FUNG|nr:Kanadaptin [Podila minutissima]